MNGADLENIRKRKLAKQNNGPIIKKKIVENNQSTDSKMNPELSDLDKAQMERWREMQKATLPKGTI